MQAQCLKKNTAFKTGEKVTYEVYYNWGLIWLNAGWVTFEVKERLYNAEPVYHFDAIGQSHENYDWIFKVRDRYQTYFDKTTLRPLWFKRDNYEGGFEVNNRYLFDYNTNKIYTETENSDTPFKRDTLPLNPCTFDLLSLVYYARNINFDTLQINQKIPLKTIIDNEFYELYMRYLGRETIETRDGMKYRCLKFSAMLVEGTIFKGGEDMYGWVTDDQKKTPVLVEAKILVGSVKAYLTQPGNQDK